MNKNSEKIRDAYDLIADDYNRELWDDLQYSEYIDKFLQYLTGSEVLDIGCAIGSFTKYIADKGYKITGIDISPKMIENAKRRVSNAYFEVMDMLELDLNKKYDGIMAINSTIHIEKKNMLDLFKSINGLLNEAGIFFIILQEGIGECEVEEPFDPNIKELVSYYQTDEVEDLFVRANFEVLGSSKILGQSDFEVGNNQLVYCLRKK